MNAEEGSLGSIETTCAFSGVSSVGLCPKKGGAQDLLESCVSFGMCLEEYNEQKMGRQQNEELLWYNLGKHR